jgi:hypothetical protein
VQPPSYRFAGGPWRSHDWDVRQSGSGKKATVSETKHVRVASRKIEWVEEHHFRGFACSECGWRYNPSGAPEGESFGEMMQNFQLQRDREFAAHVCADHSKAMGARRSR